MIWGLLDNAVKYGGGTAITVSVRTRPRGGRVSGSCRRRGAARGVGTLLLRVADAGPGIAEADRGRLFERYARGTAPSTDGTGLGLYVSRELARANDADLTVQPEVLPDKDHMANPKGDAGISANATGAAFTLLLPAESPTEG